jgi:hypothetical protein
MLSIKKMEPIKKTTRLLEHEKMPPNSVFNYAFAKA